MKKTILVVLTVMGLSATIPGQSVFIDNVNIPGAGLVLGLQTGDQINATLMGGPVGGSLVPVVTLAGGSLLNLGDGLVYDRSGLSYTIPGVPANATASLRLQFWVGSSSSYAAAVADGYRTADSDVYSNPTAGGGHPPNIPPSAMANMPNVSLIPEPSTLALAGFGAAALLMHRRHAA